MTTISTDRAAFLEDISRISRETAAVHADDVDRVGRFPAEAIEALREIGALSAYVPTEFGGAGLSLADMGSACKALARSCSATAMVFAMHQLQVAHIARHIEADGWHAEYLTRLAREQRLIASVTSEVGTGGNMGQSIAALSQTDTGTFSFEKQAPTISYGSHCDDLLTSLRRSPEAERSDQVLVLHSREATEMESTSQWDTLGMRGTCSPGFIVRAEVAPEQILTEPFSTMMAETIVPIAHILWANVWLGSATEAFERGRSFVRAASRKAPDQPVPAARQLSEILLELRLLRSEVGAATDDFERWDATENRAALNSLAAGLRFNSLKLVVSERVPGICTSALAAIGIMAYKNDSPYSIGRLLRDSMSGQLMITNERLHSTNASLLSVVKDV